MANGMDGDFEPHVHVEGSTLLVRVYVPDVKSQKCLVVNPHDTVWAAKQVILEKLNQELPKDPLNYSLYIPPMGPGKAGKFLEDHRPLIHYALQGHVPKLEMRYKSRDYSSQPSLSEKAVAKANSKTNQRKLLEHITSGSVKKIEKLLESGIDPNFVADDGNTPLGLACGRNSHVQCIVPLMSAGAHIDFRGKDALTALHRAAIGGNEKATKILLSYGASPNYRDAKGLTPLYHTAIMGDATGTSRALLRYRAETGIKDAGGWTELHQTSKYGHTEHADLFILYGADVNAQNIVGNTPLHVAASHEQSECAMLLLKRGADKMQINYSSQTPGQVAILCGHHQLSAEISNFSPDRIDFHTDLPDYDPRAKTFDSTLFVARTVSETCPLTPPPESLVGTLTQEWEEKDPLDSYSAATMKATIPAVKEFPITTTVSVSSHGSVDTESCSSLEQDSTHSDSTTGTPYQRSPAAQPRSGLSTFQHQRERLYRASQGNYIAVEDVEPLQPGDLPLWRGMHVEVVYIGKGGYWEGKAGGKQGWFPALAIKEVTEEQDTDTPDLSQEDLDKVEEPTATTFERKSNIKDITIVRGPKGYGFAMRGVKATKSMKFHPSPQVPALQYVGNVDAGGAAEIAGLRTGDFLIEVNGYNVTYSTHNEVVNVVKKSAGTLILKVITPMIRPKSTSTQIRDRLVLDSTPEANVRSESPKSLQETSKKHSKSLQSLEGTRNRRGSFDSPRRGSFDKPRSTTPTPKGSSYYRGSPVLRRIERSGWDSSQGEDLDSPTFSRKARSNYHIPVTQTSQRSGVSMYPIIQDKLEDPDSPTLEPHREEVMLQNSRLPQYKSATLPRLPSQGYPKLKETVNVTDLDGVPELSSSEEDLKNEEGSKKEEEDDDKQAQSAFALAIREKKRKIEQQAKQDTLQRIRSNTMPEPPKRTVSVLTKREHQKLEKKPSSPKQEEELEEEEEGNALSQLEHELRQASVSRNRRLSLQKPNMTAAFSDTSFTASFSGNPIASAVMRKIDSVMLDDSDTQDGSGDDFESSPQILPARFSTKPAEKEATPAPKPKPPPPVVKPKPLRKKSKTFDFGTDTKEAESPKMEGKASPETPTSPWAMQLRKTPTRERKFQPEPSSSTAEDSRPDTPTSPWNVSLRKTPKAERKFKQPQDVRQEEDGTVDWKSILRPAGNEDTPSPARFEPTSKRSEDASGSGRQQRPSLPDSTSGTETIVARVFDSQPAAREPSKPRPEDSDKSHSATPPQGAVSLYNEAPVASLPVGYKVPSGESFDDAYWSEAGGESFQPLPPPMLEDGGSNFDFSAEDLPPPLLHSHSSSFEHPEGSLTFLESLPPPVDFVSLEDADVGESTTDDFILPPPMTDEIEGIPPGFPSPPLAPPDTFPGSIPSFPSPPLAPPDMFPGSVPGLSSPPLVPPDTFPMSVPGSSSPPLAPPDTFPVSVPGLSSPPLVLPDPFPGSVHPGSSQTLEDTHLSSTPGMEGKDTFGGMDRDSISSDSDVPPPPPSTEPPPLDSSHDDETFVFISQDTALEEVDAPLNFSEEHIPSPPPPLVATTPLQDVPSLGVRSTGGTEEVAPPRPPPPAADKLVVLETSSSVSPEASSDPAAGFLQEVKDEPHAVVEAKAGYEQKSVKEWDIGEVCQWLEGIGLGEHCEQFVENEIVGEHLLDLTKDDLRELGVKKLGHQKTFLSKLSQIGK